MQRKYPLVKKNRQMDYSKVILSPFKTFIANVMLRECRVAKGSDIKRESQALPKQILAIEVGLGWGGPTWA